MPAFSDAILETQASSSLHTKTQAENCSLDCLWGFCCRESLSPVWGARPPCLPGLARAGPATATWITISIHRCSAVDREEPERCGWRVLELPASTRSVLPRLLKAPRAPPRL